MRETTESDMKEYLINHFRYYTANSWNKSTSYAMNVKIHNVIPLKYRDQAYNLLDVKNYWSEINDILLNWDYKYKYTYQIGFNGRSNGYLVLYNGGWNKVGTTWAKSSLGIDKYLEDFTDEDWESFPLKERYKLIKEFDALCDDIIKTTIIYCKRCNVVEKRGRNKHDKL